MSHKQVSVSSYMYLYRFLRTEPTGQDFLSYFNSFDIIEIRVFEAQQ